MDCTKGVFQDEMKNIVSPMLLGGGHKGVMLFGPSGTGKTYIARAVAGQFGLGFLVISAANINTEMFGGSVKNVARAFARARDHVRRKGTPAIVFVDEAEALLSRRGGGSGYGGQATDQVLTQFLQETDGANKSEYDRLVFFVVATNLPDSIDPAISNRIGNKIFVGLPNHERRRQFFTSHLPNLPPAYADTFTERSAGASERGLKNHMQEIQRAMLRRSNQNRDRVNDFVKHLRGQGGPKLPGLPSEVVINHMIPLDDIKTIKMKVPGQNQLREMVMFRQFIDENPPTCVEGQTPTEFLEAAIAASRAARG